MHTQTTLSDKLVRKALAQRKYLIVLIVSRQVLLCDCVCLCGLCVRGEEEMCVTRNIKYKESSVCLCQLKTMNVG